VQPALTWEAKESGIGWRVIAAVHVCAGLVLSSHVRILFSHTWATMTRTLDYTLAIKTGREIDPTPSACSVDLDDLLQNGSCTVEALKQHIKGSLGELALQQQYCCW